MIHSSILNDLLTATLSLDENVRVVEKINFTLQNDKHEVTSSTAVLMFTIKILFQIDSRRHLCLAEIETRFVCACKCLFKQIREAGNKNKWRDILIQSRVSLHYTFTGSCSGSISLKRYSKAFLLFGSKCSRLKGRQFKRYDFKAFHFASAKMVESTNSPNPHFQELIVKPNDD